MRIRTIKPEFWSHPIIGRLPYQVRCLAAGLLNYSDDIGLFLADAHLIRSALDPFQEDLEIVANGLRELSRIGYCLLREHAVMGSMGLIPTFSKHQVINKPSKSKLQKYWAECSGSVHVGLPEDYRPEQGTGNREEKPLGPPSSSSEQVKPVPPPPPAPPAPKSASTANGRHPPRSARRGGGGGKKNGTTASEAPPPDDEVHRAYAAARSAHEALERWPASPPAYVEDWWQLIRPEILDRRGLQATDALSRITACAQEYAVDVLAGRFPRMARPDAKPFFASEEVWRPRLPPPAPIACALCQHLGTLAPETLLGDEPICLECRDVCPEGWAQMPIDELLEQLEAAETVKRAEDARAAKEERERYLRVMENSPWRRAMNGH